MKRNRVKISAKEMENVVPSPSQRTLQDSTPIQIENRRAQVPGNYSILVGIGNRGARFESGMPEVC